jgi:hypothetical protein
VDDYLAYKGYKDFVSEDNRVCLADGADDLVYYALS